MAVPICVKDLNHHTVTLPIVGCRQNSRARCVYQQCRNLKGYSSASIHPRVSLTACVGFVAGFFAAGSRKCSSRRSIRCRQESAPSAETAETPSSLTTTPVPAWVVNLDQSTDRWAQTRAELANHNVQAERFSATLGKALSDAELAEKVTLPARYLCTPGMIGCFLSHRRAWERLVQEGHDALLMLEDDVIILHDNFNERLKLLLEELPHDWDVCLLGALGVIGLEKENFQMKLFGVVCGGTRPCPGKDTRLISPNVYVPYKPTGTHAYLISNRGAEKLLKEFPRASYHVDLTAWSWPDLKLYATPDSLATQRFGGASTVSKGGEPLTQRILSWTCQITGITDACRRGGVEDPSWAWKVAIFAFPVPFSRKRIAVEMGPVTSVWILMLLYALGTRSLRMVGVALAYQGLIACCMQWLSRTFSPRFALVMLFASAGLIIGG